jgi:hypothetical protein
MATTNYPALIRALGTDLTGLLHSKATIRFPMTAAVPTSLITRIAKLRAAEVTGARTARPEKPTPSRRRPRSAARPRSG